MKVKQNLSPSVLPTAVYPKKRWYMAGRDESWYYHGPRKEVVVPTNVDFDGTVDSDLTDLVDFLHLRRVPTTPSCQGHFHPREEFEEVWKKLQKEEKKVKTKGLLITDVETDERVLFRNQDYSLPWEDFESFYKEAGGNQQKGYIGMWIKDPDTIGHLRHLLTGPSKFNFFREVGQIDNKILFALGVSQKDEDAQKKAWSQWTKKIRDAFLGLY